MPPRAKARLVAVLLLLAATLPACGGPDRTGPDPWQWEAERGTTFAALRDECLAWQREQVASNLATRFEEGPTGAFLFNDFGAVAEALDGGSESCEALRLEWPGDRGRLDVIGWLDLLHATDGDPRRDPEALYAFREDGPLLVVPMAELLLFDSTVTGIIAERPTAEDASRAVGRTLRFTWGLDLGESARLDDSVVILALAETVPDMSSELRAAPPEMAGWAALAGVLRYLAADLYRLAWCYRDTLFGPPLRTLVEAAASREAGDGSLSRAAGYYSRHRAHFDARCRPLP